MVYTVHVTLTSSALPQELVMDILHVLSSPDLEVRKKTLSLVLDLVNSRNVEEVSPAFGCVGHVISCDVSHDLLQVVMVLKKEVANTSNGGEGSEAQDLSGYRQCLVRTLHTCSIRFSIVAPAVVPLVGVGTPSFCLLVYPLPSSPPLRSLSLPSPLLPPPPLPP